VLIADEILRVPSRQLSILLTALSPDEGFYYLRTGRILEVVDGIAREETLAAPISNLCIIATTNVGAEYHVDEIDPALAERFVVLRKETNEAELQRILTAQANAKGFKLALVNNSLKFYKKMVEAQSRGLVARIPTTRTLVRAFETATNEADVARMLKTQILLWVARTSEGQPVPEQVTTVAELITRNFK
jgi:MoxR-like ATPase